MKVYLAYWCNNEAWEDYSKSVDGVYSSRAKAVASIESKGYRKGPTEYYPHASKERWNKESWFDDLGQPWELHSMWVREMEVNE